MSKQSTFIQKGIKNKAILKKALEAAGLQFKEDVEVIGYHKRNYGKADFVIKNHPKLASHWESGVKYDLGFKQNPDGTFSFIHDDNRMGQKQIQEFTGEYLQMYNAQECRQTLEDMGLTLDVQKTDNKGNIIVSGYNDRGESIDFTIEKTGEITRHVQGIKGAGCAEWAEKAQVGRMLTDAETTEYYETVNPPEMEMNVGSWNANCMPHDDNSPCG